MARQSFKQSLNTAFLLALMIFFISPLARAVTTCDCEESACGACQVETGVTFYSAKCGPNDARVKSCKKPTCEPVENHKSCMALLEKNSGAAKTDREPASAKSAEAPAPVPSIAGEVVNVDGIAKIIRASGPVENPVEKLVVYEGDQVETKTNGKVKIRLKDASEMIVAANSRVKIELVKVDDAAGTRNVTLNLLLGKVRSRVQKKYEGGNSFNVRTRAAVAGVRGTDFVAVFEPGEKEWVSEVRTFEGLVHLEAAKKRGEESKPGKAVDVPAGTYASLVIGPPQRLDDEEEFFKSIDAGFVSPVYKMKDDEAQKLDEATEFAAATTKKESRSTASVGLDSDQLCQEPNGRFNQCSYTCEGKNPSGESKCRTDLPGVTCVRRLCRANGSWAEQTRLPASQSDQCTSGRPVVRDCGIYW